MTATTENPLSVTWTSINTGRTRRASDRLEAFLDEPGYTVAGCYERNGQIAIVYGDPAVHGLFAVRLEDVDLINKIAAGADAYSEWCTLTTDMADEHLARALLADGETRIFKYAGTCSQVLVQP